MPLSVIMPYFLNLVPKSARNLSNAIATFSLILAQNISNPRLDGKMELLTKTNCVRLQISVSRIKFKRTACLTQPPLVKSAVKFTPPKLLSNKYRLSSFNSIKAQHRLSGIRRNRTTGGNKIWWARNRQQRNFLSNLGQLFTDVLVCETGCVNGPYCRV